MVSDTPETHKRISHAEKEYILSSLADQVCNFAIDFVWNSAANHIKSVYDTNLT